MKAKKIDFKTRNAAIKKAVKGGEPVAKLAKRIKLSASMIYRIIR